MKLKMQLKILHNYYYIKMSISDLVNELNIPESKIGSTISHKFVENSDKIISILEKYNINNLIIVINFMKKYQDELFKTIIERRQICSDDKVTDNKNLVCGFNVISNGINQIKLLIKNKETLINKQYDMQYELENIKIGIILVFIIVFIICYSIYYLLFI